MGLDRSPIRTEYFLKSVEEDYWSDDEVITMSKVKYRIHSPYLDVSAFNPLRPSNNPEQLSQI